MLRDLLHHARDTIFTIFHDNKWPKIKKDREIQIDVKIDHVENLGFEKIIYSKVLENQIIIKSSENINNNSLKVSFSKDKVLFFDKDKNRIR